MKTIATLIAAMLALVLQGRFAAAQASSTSTGAHCTGMTVTDSVSSYASDNTTSQSWVNITDGQLNFTTSSTGCVAITFSGPAFAASNIPNTYNTLHVRTLLDGNNLCVQASYSDIFSQAVSPQPEIASSITRICKNVAAGTHAVQVQYHSDAAGNATIISHVLTVTHN